MASSTNPSKSTNADSTLGSHSPESGKPSSSEHRHLIIRSTDIQERAIEAVRQVKIDKDHPVEVIIRPHEKIRSLPQNSRYWATLTELLNRIQRAVHVVSEFTGYSPLEVKRLLAADMPAEYSAILFCPKPEPAHEVMKEICGIPTSTRLGTKKFMAFEERMEQVMADIEGYVNAFERKAAA